MKTFNGFPVSLPERPLNSGVTFAKRLSISAIVVIDRGYAGHEWCVTEHLWHLGILVNCVRE